MSDATPHRLSPLVLLVIMDGLGLRPKRHYNSVIKAKTPTLERLFKTCPNIPIDGSGRAVGLPVGQMGNSEVGHLNLGAGRIVYQDITLIDYEIDSGAFFKNPRLTAAIGAAKKRGAALHLLGLVSDGCVHSSLNHLRALLHLAAMSKLNDVYIHAFTDGRDTSPTGGVSYLKTVRSFLSDTGIGKLSTVIGRYWAMDRDKRWDRTQLAYDAMVKGKGEHTKDILASVKNRYDSDETDEFLKPLIVDQSSDRQFIKQDDLVICCNFRADRMRQICYYLTGSNLKNAPSPDALGVDLLTMTNYDSELTDATVLYPPRPMDNILGEVVSRQGMKQLRIAETEKYAHVTFFFNGGLEKPYDNEDRLLVPSPKVATYDKQPEMSQPEVTEKLCAHIRERKYDVMILNFANCDMVGHTGSLDAAIAAVEAVDGGLGKILEALDEVGGDALITADHGNCEQMWDENTNGPHTAHTTNFVPLIFYGKNKERFAHPMRSGVLADIAPTILELLGISKPSQMTGSSFSNS